MPPACCDLVLRIRPPTAQKIQHRKVLDFLWWGRTDSNHRSETQQIYSLSPLATRELPRILLRSVETEHAYYITEFGFVKNFFEIYQKNCRPLARPAEKEFELQLHVHLGDDSSAAGAQALGVGGFGVHPAAGALGTLGLGNTDGQSA